MYFQIFLVSHTELNQASAVNVTTPVFVYCLEIALPQVFYGAAHSRDAEVTCQSIPPVSQPNEWTCLQHNLLQPLSEHYPLTIMRELGF